MIIRLIALVTYDWKDMEETLIELFFKSEEHAEQWVEENRDQYQSFHYVITSEDRNEYEGIIDYKDEYWEDEDDEDEEEPDCSTCYYKGGCKKDFKDEDEEEDVDYCDDCGGCDYCEYEEKEDY